MFLFMTSWLAIPHWLAGTAAAPSQTNVDLVLDRYRRLLCDDATHSAASAPQLTRSLAASGQWADIDYADRSPSAWAPAVHLYRVRQMALALVTKQVRDADAASLRRAVGRALDYWIAKRDQWPNWWWNEIGVPRHLRDIIVLLGPELDAARRRALIDILGTQLHVRGTGANLVWTAELALHHGCLTGNETRVAQAAQRIWAEVKVGAGEGIQPDGSFYQHGPRLQTFHYGKAYLSVVGQLAWELRGTPWAMPRDKQSIITRYVLDGPQWMCRGVFTVPGTMDRQASRRGSLRAADLRAVLRRWIEVDPRRRAEIEAFIARQDGHGRPLVGFRHFPHGDFTCYHRPSASFFLKTVSTRTRFTESINGENLKGVPYLNCGDHYILRNGRGYHELQPVWEWEHLPGLTTAGGTLRQERRAFVGGMGNKRSGLAAMDYVRVNPDGNRLATRKSWFFHGDLVIGLIGPLELNHVAGPVTSSIEQCRWRGPVRARLSDGRSVELNGGRHTLQSARWFLHAGVGYLPLGSTRLEVFLGEREGSWRSINHSYRDAPVKDRLFQLLLEHDEHAANTGTGWVLMLDATVGKLNDLSRQPAWRVLRNAPDCQAVRFDDDLVMASFFTPGRLEAVGGSLQVDKPCLVMATADELWLSDPTMQGGEITVRWKDRRQTLRLPPDGQTARLANRADHP